MKTNECRALVRKHGLSMMRALAISQWRIDFRYDEIKADDVPAKFSVKATTDLCYRYEKAVVTINPEQMEDEKDFLQSLRHELIHLLLAPFHAYDDYARTIMPERTEWMTVNKIYHDRCEEMVLKVERMLEWGLNQTPAKMAAGARRRWGEEAPKRRKKRRRR